MLQKWSLSVRRRENDPPDHFLTLLHLELPCPHYLDAILPHQPTHTVLANLQTQLIQLLRHARLSEAAQAQAMLVAEMGQEHHVTPLAV